MRTGRNTALLVSSYLGMVHAKDQSSDIGNIISLTICALVILGASYACYRGVYFFLRRLVMVQTMIGRHSINH